LSLFGATQITDAVGQALAELPLLTFLDLFDTRVSAIMAKHIQTRNPTLELHIKQK
jgi:hypothetical protein